MEEERGRERLGHDIGVNRELHLREDGGRPALGDEHRAAFAGRLLREPGPVDEAHPGRQWVHPEALPGQVEEGEGGNHGDLARRGFLATAQRCARPPAESPGTA